MAPRGDTIRGWRWLHVLRHWIGLTRTRTFGAGGNVVKICDECGEWLA